MIFFADVIYMNELACFFEKDNILTTKIIFFKKRAKSYRMTATII